MSKIALYTTCDDKYIPYAITALLTFDDHNKDVFDMFILSKTMDTTYQLICDKFNITWIEIDCSDDFPVDINHTYPSECYWIFKGPELFYKKGYEYSISIDCDVLCNTTLDLSWISKILFIGGAERRVSISTLQFLYDFAEDTKDKYNELFELTHMPCINTGFVVYNNKKCVSLNFYDNIIKLNSIRYNNHLKPYVGDDDLFALFMSVYSDYKYAILNNKWNFFYNVNYNINYPFYIAHFVNDKPWNVDNEVPIVKKWKSYYNKLFE